MQRQQPSLHFCSRTVSCKWSRAEDSAAVVKLSHPTFLESASRLTGVGTQARRVCVDGSNL